MPLTTADPLSDLTVAGADTPIPQVNDSSCEFDVPVVVSSGSSAFYDKLEMK